MADIQFTLPRFQVVRNRVRLRDGSRMNYDTIDIRDGVSILPLHEGNIVLGHEYVFGAKSYSLELPGGGIYPETGEQPLTTAQRKLRQEMGITAKEWTPLGSVRQVTSLIDHKEHLYLARDLKFGATEEHPMTEEIAPFTMSLEEAVDRVMANGMPNNPFGNSLDIQTPGSIGDAAASTLILKAHLYLQNPQRYQHLFSK